MNAAAGKASPPTRFVAFYSYKGGVGRTLALANCARAMAASGKQVVLLDFDLEAPGLHHFPTLKPGKNAAGFVEYLQACLDGQPPDSLNDYVHPCPGQKEDKGRAWIMPAGQHDNPAYLEFLNHMNWADFYSEQVGYQILENLRGHLMEQFQPDYVLMDARTGLSEIGGIATHQLADIVVLLFNLNEQNLHGAHRVFHSVKHSPMQPKIILAASPVPTVPTGKGTPFYARMQYIRKHFSGAENTKKPLVIPYNPLLAFGETILVDEHDDPFSSDEPYRQLLELIKKAAGVDADYYLEKAADAWRQGDLSKAKDWLQVGVEQNPTVPALWHSLGSVLSLLNEPENAITAYTQTIRLTENSNTPEIRRLVAIVLIAQGVAFGQIDKKDEALAAYIQVVERFGSNNQPELQKQVAKALYNQGVMLKEMGKLDEALVVYAQFMERFGSSKQPELQEIITHALVNQGTIFGKQGKPGKAIAIYTQVVERFGASDQPELHEPVARALINQGFTLICEAKRMKASGDSKTFLQRLAEATASLEKARSQRQNDSIWLQNYAYLLYLQGHPEQAETTLRQALEAGGASVLDDCREDADIHRLPEDDGFLALVDKLAVEASIPLAPKL